MHRPFVSWNVDGHRLAGVGVGVFGSVGVDSTQPFSALFTAVTNSLIDTAPSPSQSPQHCAATLPASVHTIAIAMSAVRIPSSARVSSHAAWAQRVALAHRAAQPERFDRRVTAPWQCAPYYPRFTIECKFNPSNRGMGADFDGPICLVRVLLCPVLRRSEADGIDRLHRAEADPAVLRHAAGAGR